MSDGTPEKRHREDSHNGGDDEKKKKNEKESDQADTSQQLTHGSPEEHHRVGEVNGGADDNCSYASSTSASSMSNGLSSFISSVIEEYDSKAEATISSQNQLTFALDRLTGELDQLLDDAPLPFIMQHAARISGVRKRVKSLNLVLKSIQRRVDNIDRILSAGSMQGNSGSNS